jgi:DNA-binding winged helix-turn-helix (wHTH) protein/tetratricopeptide (TPR) repeat protein
MTLKRKDRNLNDAQNNLTAHVIGAIAVTTGMKFRLGESGPFHLRGERVGYPQRKAAILQAAQPTVRMRFGAFEADLSAGELRKHGIRLKLHDQPFQVLSLLLDRPGELITREEIQQKLWPSGTFVDFENGLNSAVNRLRDALSDSAEEPRFIETIPRRGYRFIAPVERLNGNVAPVGEAEPEPSVHRTKHWLWLVSAAAAAVLVVAAFGGWRLTHSAKKTLNFAARDWVLISSFGNRTGNPVLDGTLEYALERELSNSQFVNVVPRERTDDALRLMRKPLDTKIDAAVGREICLRDGGIRALLTGRIEKLGTVYVLSAQLIDPVRGVAVASLSEEDPADSQMAAAVRRLSNRVRETLGEKRALIQQGNQQLEKVTTPSLHALQLYTQANELMRVDGNQAAAAELLKQALVDDPNFASTHLLLGYTYANRGKDAEARPEFQRAFDLANSTPDRERLFIQASYYQAVQKDVPKAIEVYEALLRLYPDHYWAANNLTGLYEDTGRWDDSLKLSLRLADLRPDDLGVIEGAACGMFVTKNLDAAMPYIENARALAAADPDRARMIAAAGANAPAYDGTVEMLPVMDSWLRGDVTKAHSQIHELMNSGKELYYSAFLWSLGELGEAERHTKAVTDPEFVELYLGMGSYIKGDLPAARKHFQNYKGDLGGTPGVVVVRAGLLDKVEAKLREHTGTNHSIQVVRAEFDMARGRTKEGVALLEKGLDGMQLLPGGAFYLGSETLARAYEKQGDLDAALRVLQRAAAGKGKVSPCIGPFGGAWWLRDELQLADLYRKMGRMPEAERVENELRKMLIYADADHPILRELQKREPMVAAAPAK